MFWQNFDKRPHHTSCRYWGLNDPFWCVHHSRDSQNCPFPWASRPPSDTWFLQSTWVILKPHLDRHFILARPWLLIDLLQEQYCNILSLPICDPIPPETLKFPSREIHMVKNRWSKRKVSNFEIKNWLNSDWIKTPSHSTVHQRIHKLTVTSFLHSYLCQLFWPPWYGKFKSSPVNFANYDM